MKKTMLREHLALAERHVAEGERHIGDPPPWKHFSRRSMEEAFYGDGTGSVFTCA